MLMLMQRILPCRQMHLAAARWLDDLDSKIDANLDEDMYADVDVDVEVDVDGHQPRSWMQPLPLPLLLLLLLPLPLSSRVRLRHVGGASSAACKRTGRLKIRSRRYVHLLSVYLVCALR